MNIFLNGCVTKCFRMTEKHCRCHSVCQHCSGFALPRRSACGVFQWTMTIWSKSTQWHMKAEQTHLSISHFPFLPSCLFSYCPKEGHFCPMGDNNIDVKRWVIDWEERTLRQLICSRLLLVPNNLSIYTCMWHVWRNINFSLGWYVSFEFFLQHANQTSTCIEVRGGCGRSSPLQATWALPVTYLYMLGNATLLCSNALRYMQR